MNTEQQSGLEEIKKLINDRFDKQDEKINDLKLEIVKSESRVNQRITESESKLGQEITKVDAKIGQSINEVESKLGQKINEVESKLSQEITKVDAKFSEQIAGIKVDITWIKWLFGGLLSFILLLLCVILTVLFKLVG